MIVPGVSRGSGEFLLGPAVFVRHGLSLLWVVGVAVMLRTIFNTELMRYTLATGEPVFTGFMRTTSRSCCSATICSLELDLSAANLPAGSRLRAGTATLEVTPEPVSRGDLRHLNLREVYMRVVEAGAIASDAPVQLLSRPPQRRDD